MSRKLTIVDSPRRFRLLLLLAGGILGAASSTPCQDLVDQILISFPAETSRIEYARPAALRRLPEYAGLRGQFLGLRLSAMDAALSTLGIEEGDIDEAALAWAPRQGSAAQESPEAHEGNTDGNEPVDGRIRDLPTDLAGLLTGRFDQNRIAQFAAENSVVSIRMHEADAYCLGQKAAGACLVVLNESLAAFGEPAALRRLLETRLGVHGSLGADRRFTGLINEVDRYAPIWGIATGSTVPEWFRGWMPAQGQAPMDWANAFDSVEAFVYSIEAGEKLRLTASLKAESAEVAQKLQQLFSGVRTLLALFWQTQAPGQPNPLADLRVTTEGRVCVLTLAGTLKDITAYRNSPLRPPVSSVSSGNSGQ